MGVFIAMYIFFGLVYLISRIIRNLQRKKIFICFSCFFVLWLILALRDVSIGVDLLQGYIPKWDNFSGSISDVFYFDEYGREIGWQLYFHLVKVIIGDNFNLFLAITAFLTLFPIAIFIKRYSVNPLLSIIIYSSFILYHFSFSGLRQALAIGITTIGYFYVVEKKLIPFLLCVLSAYLIHKSSILFIIVYPLCNIDIKRWVYILLLAVWLLSLFSLRTIIGYLTSFLFSETSYNEYVISGSGSYMLMILYLLFFLMTFLIRVSPYDKTSKHFSILMLLMLFSQSIGLVTYAAARISFYYLPFLALMLPQFSNSYDRTSRKIINVCIVIFMIFFFFYNNSDGYLDVIPYKFFWQP